MSVSETDKRNSDRPFTGGISSPTALSPLGRLHIAEWNDVLRRGEPVTSGIPLSETLGIIDQLRLRVLDEHGRETPLQIRVLSRWGDLTDHCAPIRWVLLDFNADVVANATALYRLAVADAPSSPPDTLRLGWQRVAALPAHR